MKWKITIRWDHSDHPSLISPTTVPPPTTPTTPTTLTTLDPPTTLITPMTPTGRPPWPLRPQTRIHVGKYLNLLKFDTFWVYDVWVVGQLSKSHLNYFKLDFQMHLSNFQKGCFPMYQD